MFLLEKLIKALITLPALLSLMVLVGAYIYVRHDKKNGKRVLFGALVLGWFFCTDMALYVMTRPLIGGLHEFRIQDLPSEANILVLGGGCRNGDFDNPAERLSDPSLRRAIEGFRIWRHKPDAKLIFSGTDWSRDCNIAEIAARMVSVWKADSAKILQLNPARNTREEAALYFQNFGAEKPLILVSSAIHLPRAIRNFKNKGIKVIPAPTDFPMHHDKFRISDVLPDAGNFQKCSAVWIEWMANLAGK